MSTMEVIPAPRQTDLEIERQRFLPVMKTEMALDRRQAVVDAFKKLMKDGDDYGTIPGTKQPTLLQPGAQKLDNLFGLVPRFTIVLQEEDWTGERHAGEPFFRYLIACQLYRSEFVMGEAIGECNSWESKYRYRIAERKCPDCGAGAILQTKHKSGPEEGQPKNFWCAPFKGGCGHGFKLEDPRVVAQEIGRKPNPEIFDQVNTLVKMAQKRAHVAATINATSASEFFTQDLDDRAEAAETQAEVVERRIQEETPKPHAVPDKFKMLKEFGTVKADLHKLDATDKLYYDILGAEGVEHADQIKTHEQASRIYKLLKAKVAEELERLGVA
jgi:hypothetical protein